MPFPSQRSSLAQLPGNVSTTERWLSAAAGLGLLLSAARGDALGRIARGGAGLSLLIRGTTGYCAVKGAVQGETTLRNGFVRQWQRLAEKAETVRALSSEGAQIDSMETLYGAELQELHSAEMQFCALANELVPSIGSSSLAFRIQEYATELQARKVDLDSLLARAGLDAREHPDDAMRALVHETHKMAHVCVEGVRDAAVAASLQRIIHYKIAGYGTIASYAKALGRIEEAGHFAQSADRDKAIDAELTELAKETLNAQALQAPHTEATPMTTH